MRVEAVGATTRSRTVAAVLAVLAALGVLLTGPAPAAHAAGNGDWSIDPFVAEGNNQNSRRYFFLEGAPGTSVADSVTVANSSNRAMNFKLFGTDAYNTPRDGGFALKTSDEKQIDLGSWVKVAPDKQQLTLEPGQKAVIPFTVEIPANAQPGDHIGAVTALNGEVIKSEQQGQIKVNTKQQIGARVYLRVQGAALAALNVEDVRIERETGFGAFFGSKDAVVHYTLVNPGNVIVAPQVGLEATGLFGRKVLNQKMKPTSIPELLPGQKVELSQKWSDVPRLDQVSLKIKVDGGQPGTADTESGSFTAIPWPFLSLLALILIAGGVFWNRRRGKSQGGDKGSAGDDAPKPEGGALKEPKSEADKGVSDATTAEIPPVVTEAPVDAEPAKAEPAKTEEPEPAKAEEKKPEPAEEPERAAGGR